MVEQPKSPAKTQDAKPHHYRPSSEEIRETTQRLEESLKPEMTRQALRDLSFYGENMGPSGVSFMIRPIGPDQKDAIYYKKIRVQDPTKKSDGDIFKRADLEQYSQARPSQQPAKKS
jgi:hypothetical protein